jgi:hypothetical protein
MDGNQSAGRNGMKFANTSGASNTNAASDGATEKQAAIEREEEGDRGHRQLLGELVAQGRRDSQAPDKRKRAGIPGVRMGIGLCSRVSVFIVT